MTDDLKRYEKLQEERKERFKAKALAAVSNLPPEFMEQMADLTSHRIDGIARMGNIPFACPLITEIVPNLWQGGCPPYEVPAYFQFVLNLYPWEKYKVSETTQIRYEQLYDSEDIASTGLLFELAEWVNEKRKIGPTLVHCQAGLNRSALVTALALMLEGMSASEAIMLLRTNRSPAVLCNPTFETWLRSIKLDKRGRLV